MGVFGRPDKKYTEFLTVKCGVKKIKYYTRPENFLQYFTNQVTKFQHVQFQVDIR